jgi:TPR repeat protein
VKKAILWILAGSMLALAAHADEPQFERMQSDAYKAMLRDATVVYDRKDYARAFELNRRAACAGDKTSQAILGRMYLLGQGTSKDEINGYAWIKVAAEFRFADFTSLAHKLEEAMTAEQRAKGSARADELRKDYGLAATNMSCRGESVHGVYLIDGVGCTPPSAGGGTVLVHRCAG